MPVLLPDLLAPGDFPVPFGPFELRALLGEGATGRVFRARSHGALGVRTSVALKVVRGPLVQADPTVGAALQREARLGAALQPPNLLSVQQAGVHEDTPWLAMELIEGGSLRDLLGEQARVPPDDALDLVRGIGSGLVCMHESRVPGAPRGVVHRDLKPPSRPAATGWTAARICLPWGRSCSSW